MDVDKSTNLEGSEAEGSQGSLASQAGPSKKRKRKSRLGTQQDPGILSILEANQEAARKRWEEDKVFRAEEKVLRQQEVELQRRSPCLWPQFPLDLHGISTHLQRNGHGNL